MIFPNCLNKKSLEETSTVYGSASGACPRSHPYGISRIYYLVMHSTASGIVPNPLMVSAEGDDWYDYTLMHGDYFAANQPVFNSELVDLCLRNAPNSVIIAHPRCVWDHRAPPHTQRAQ